LFDAKFHHRRWWRREARRGFDLASAEIMLSRPGSLVSSPIPASARQFARRDSATATTCDQHPGPRASARPQEYDDIAPPAAEPLLLLSRQE